MTNALGFDALKGIFVRRSDQWPDHRKPGRNTRYPVKDAALGAFGIFCTPAPAFLDSQRHLPQAKGRNHACTLVGVDQIPCHKQIRHLLDPLMPRHLNGVYLEVFEGLEQHGLWRPLRGLADQLLVALDGTQDQASHAIHCQNCLSRHTSQGQTFYYHSAIPPVIVCPGRSEVMALPPEFIMPQDGHAKQDGERGAGTRWMDHPAKQVAPHGVTLLGDAISSNQPLGRLALQNGCNCIFVCKPDSHATLSERLAFLEATDAIKKVERRRRSGRVTEILMDRYLNEVVLRSGQGALSVHWLESTSVHAKTGQQLYSNSFIPNHHITDDNVDDMARAGRGRWKIEHANNNVLKTQGYHIAPNFGHGQQSLAAFMLSLNLLAFLFHTVLQWCDDRDALLRKTLARRPTFFDDIRALTRYMVFESWHHFMDFMIRGLELEDRLAAQRDTG